MNQAEALLKRLPAIVIKELEQLGLIFGSNHESDKADSSTLEVLKLTHGLSNQNYLIDNGQHKWVLRCNSSASDQLCNRKAEVRNWRLAADAGIAPALLYVSTDHSFYLSEYIDEDTTKLWANLLSAETAHPFTHDTAIWPEADQQLLVLLQELTRLDTPENITDNPEQWRLYFKQLSEIEACIVSEASSGLNAQWLTHFKQLLSLESKISQWLQELSDCALGLQYSHRDLNPHNLLCKGGTLCCIDFEYACGSHPLFDLAGVLSTHKLSTPQRQRLIDAYLLNHPKLTSDAKAALPAAINIYWFFAASWSLLMASDNSSNSDMENLSNSNPHKAQEYLNCFEQFFSLID